jgi:hypothetical protein
MRTNCIVKLSKLQISKLNTLVQKETSGDVEGKPPPSDRNRYEQSIKLSIEAYVERLVTKYYLNNASISYTLLLTLVLKLEKRNPTNKADLGTVK